MKNKKKERETKKKLTIKKKDYKKVKKIKDNFNMGFKFSGLSGALGVGSVASPLTLLGTAGAFGDTAANIGLTMYGMNQQKSVSREDYNRQINMWNMTNDYNSPVAQMARYKTAGLNPNLIYGQSNTASMPNVDATNLNTNFDRITAMSDAMDGVYNAMDRKDAEEAMKLAQKEKEEAKKRQEIIDARTARAFDMEMKIKEAQYRNLMAKPALEVQKNQVLAQKEIDKQHNKVGRAFFSGKNFWRSGRVLGALGSRKLLGEIPTKILGKFVGPVVGSLWPALEMGFLFNDYANYITDPKTLDKASNWGRKYSPFARQYEENIWR